jgi:hypothetical protein
VRAWPAAFGGVTLAGVSFVGVDFNGVCQEGGVTKGMSGTYDGVVPGLFPPGEAATARPSPTRRPQPSRRSSVLRHAVSATITKLTTPAAVIVGPVPITVAVAPSSSAPTGMIPATTSV